MPSYQEINGSQYSDALLEAAAIARTYSALLETFEIYHPVGTPDGPLYVVLNKVAFSGRIELTATRNAGTYVDFLASRSISDQPEESGQADRMEKQLRIPGISGSVAAALRLARGSLVPWELFERHYISTEPGGPAFMPVLPLYILSYALDEKAVTFSAGYGNPSNVSVPAVKFRRTEYPTLSP